MLTFKAQYWCLIEERNQGLVFFPLNIEIRLGQIFIKILPKEVT